MNFRNRKFVRTIQIIFGLYLIFMVVSGIFQLLPPPNFNEAGMALLNALFATGYLGQLMQIVFFAAGLMFLFDKWSAFGAILLAPITTNIALFHIFLDLTGWWLALIFIALNVYLIVVHWPRYRLIFSN